MTQPNINFRLSAELLARIDKLAAEQHRNRTDLVVDALVQVYSPDDKNINEKKKHWWGK